MYYNVNSESVFLFFIFNSKQGKQISRQTAQAINCKEESLLSLNSASFHDASDFFRVKLRLEFYNSAWAFAIRNVNFSARRSKSPTSRVYKTLTRSSAISRTDVFVWPWQTR